MKCRNKAFPWPSLRQYLPGLPTSRFPRTTQKKREDEAARKAREDALNEAELSFSQRMEKAEAEKAEVLRKTEVKAPI